VATNEKPREQLAPAGFFSVRVCSNLHISSPQLALGLVVTGATLPYRSDEYTAQHRGSSTEGRLLGHGLASGVDHLGADAGLLGPGRNQAPAHRQQLKPAFRILADDREELGGRSVEAQDPAVIRIPIVPGPDMPLPLDVGIFRADVAAANRRVRRGNGLATKSPAGAGPRSA